MSNMRKTQRNYSENLPLKLKNLTKAVLPSGSPDSKLKNGKIDKQPKSLEEMNEIPKSPKFQEKSHKGRVYFFEPNQRIRAPGVQDEGKGKQSYLRVDELAHQTRRNAVCVMIEKEMMLESGYSLYQSRKAMVLERTFEERFSIF